MTPVRFRVPGAVLLLFLATLPGCTGPEPAPITVAPSTSVVRTTPSTQADAGAVAFEVGGPPGANLTISWGVGAVTGHTDHPAPWSRSEIAPMTAFSVTLQASLHPGASGNVNCRITVEGKEVASKTQEGGALCTAMNLNRAMRPSAS